MSRMGQARLPRPPRTSPAVCIKAGRPPDRKSGTINSGRRAPEHKRGDEGNDMEIREFKVNSYAYGRDTITASGRRSYGTGLYCINDSAILTRLIQEAGRYCERFASDLFIDWTGVQNGIRDMTDGADVTYLFGFRQDGVDGATYVTAFDGDRARYRSLWRLDVVTTGEKIEMTLGRVF